MALNFKHLLQCDDALDVFAVHGVGGIVGNLLTAIFAQKRYANEIDGGWLDGNWIQMVHQLADTGAGLIWSFTMTFIILWVMNKIPGLSLRVDIEVERNGLDQGELGFSCYEHVADTRARRKSIAQLGTLKAVEKEGHINHNFQPESRLRKNGAVELGIQKIAEEEGHINHNFQTEESKI